MEPRRPTAKDPPSIIHSLGEIAGRDWPTVWAVVLNWRNAEMTADCVRSLEKCGYPNLEILIVDNGSADGSSLYLRKEFPFHHHMPLPLNLGYAGGNSAGLLRALRDPECFAVLVINNDCLVSEGFLFPLVAELLDHPETGVAGPVQLRYEDGELVWANAGSRFSLWRARIAPEGPSGREAPAPGRRAEVGFHCGACALYRSDALRDVGLFDPTLFLFGEEADWAFRAAKAGWKTVVQTSSHVIHLESLSTSAVPVAGTYYVCRNTSWLIRRHGSRTQIALQVLRTLFGRGLRSVIKNVIDGRPDIAWAKFRGSAEGLWADASRAQLPEEAAFHQVFELESLDGSLKQAIAAAGRPGPHLSR